MSARRRVDHRQLDVAVRVFVVRGYRNVTVVRGNRRPICPRVPQGILISAYMCATRLEYDILQVAEKRYSYLVMKRGWKILSTSVLSLL